MDRRGFMMTSVWLSSGLSGAWPWLARVAGHHAALAVFDSTLPLGLAFAAYATHHNVPAFDIAADAGTLWYSTLAPRLAQTQPGVAAFLSGLVRPSDYFVLNHLASRMADMSGHRSEHRAAHIVFALTLTPRSIDEAR